MTNAPLLPLDDPDCAARAEQIAAARQNYPISFDIIPGLPCVEKVPDDAKPSLRWLIDAGDKMIKIFRNLAANRLSMVADDIEIHLSVDDDTKIEDLFSESSLDGFVSALKEAVDQKVGTANHSITGVLDQIQLLLSGQHLKDQGQFRANDPWGSPLTPSGRPKAVSDFDALFRHLDRPPVMETWNDDGWFARMRVAGPNPMLLRGITELPSTFPVTEAQFARSAVVGDTLAKALAEGRLFLLDYRLIGEVVVDSPAVDGTHKYTPTPLALFGVRPDAGELYPIAIQAGQDPSQFAIVTPDDYWPWRKAKTAVQVADANYHELIVHLGRTHLVAGAVALATYHHFAPAHPVWVLLTPHFEGTLAINDSAAHSMLAPGGAIDLSFGGKLESMIALTARGVTDFDFHGLMPPADFVARGVGKDSKLVNYPYRDDALRYWEAISAWTRGYIDIYYADDQAIVADPELQDWSAALTAPVNQGGVAGFRPITDRATLAASLAMIIFTASVQHAAVNFPQWTQMSYAPGLAGALWAPWTDGPATEQDWLDLLPPLQYGELQAEFLALLGGINHTRLGTYESSSFPYEDLIVDARVADGPLQAFVAALRRIGAAIEADNAALTNRSAPYPYLLPSAVPASINV